MTRTRSTGQVAEELGVPTHRLEYLLRDRQIRPEKGPTGAFAWSESDFRMAGRLLGLDTKTIAAKLAVDENPGSASDTRAEGGAR